MEANDNTNEAMEGAHGKTEGMRCADLPEASICMTFPQLELQLSGK
jgi:hypothetical protein